MSALTPLLRRILAVGMLFALLAALWTLVVVPIGARFESYEQSIARSEALLARYLRIGAARDELRAELERVREKQESMSGFLKGPSVELVAAELQNKVKGLIEASGGELNSIQTLPESMEHGFRKVEIRAIMTIDTPALRQVLHALETANPYLFLDNVDIRAQRKRAESASGLQVRYDVYGYMQVEEP